MQKPILLNGIDGDLWRRFRACAAYEDKTASELIREVIENAVDRMEEKVLSRMSAGRLAKAQRGEKSDPIHLNRFYEEYEGKTEKDD